MEKIRRTDSFFVFAKTPLHPTDHQVLSLLYLPLIGTQAYSLYGLFANLLNRQTLKSDLYLHHDLESLLSHKLTTIESARHHLEAIGLLNVYFYNDCFAYELLNPLTPSAFINDGILGQYLQAAVTENRFKKLCQMFKIESWDKSKYVPITKSFNDIYPNMIQSSFEPIEGLMNGSRGTNIQIKRTDFDFRLFSDSIPEPFLDKKQLTPEVKTKIINLAYVYGLDELAMKEVYLKSTSQDYQLDITKLSKFAREAFKIQKASLSSATDENQTTPDSPIKMQSDPLNYLKTATPKQLLSDLSGGMVSTADLRIMERLIEDIGLDRGVVNCLVYYTVTSKDGRMPTYEYFEKVAMSWKRNQINTVEDALDYIQHLKSDVKTASSSTKPKRKSYSTKPDVKIDWLDDYLKSIE